MKEYNTCQICNKSFSLLGSHVSQVHKEITLEQYYISYIGKVGTCGYCNRNTKFRGLSEGYAKYCTITCRNKDPKMKDRIKRTNLLKYGCLNTFQFEEFKEKIKRTNIERYGVLNISQNEAFKNKKMETTFNTLGVFYPAQSPLMKLKSQQSCMKHYGVCHPLKSLEVIAKIKLTNIKNHGTSSPIVKQFNFCTKLYKLKDVRIINYQSNPLKLFIEQCENNGILIYDGDVIPYTFNGKAHLYFVDFKIKVNGNYQLVLIKQNHHWYKRALESGLMLAKNNAVKNYSKEMGYLNFLFLMV